MKMSKLKKRKLTGKAAILAAALAATTAISTLRADVTAPDLVTSEALFWLDASTLSAAAGTELDSWADVRGGSYPGVTTYTDIKPQVIEIADGPLAGKKAVTFFTVGTKCDMKFAANQTVRTAFFVVDIDQNINAFLLGGVGGSNNPYYPLHRGSNGAYFYGNSAPACSYWNDGVKIASPTTELVPTGYQLITWQLDANITPVVNRITQDRAVSARVGGKRLCEVVAFNRILSDYERIEVEAYLKAKWYGEMPQMTEMTSRLAKKLGGATVHFDASVTSSFHYGVDGDETGKKVSQWDDISGNNNHFITNITAATPNYGTVGTVAGQPVFDSGAASSGIDLKLGSVINARTVFLVAEVERSGNVFWLGDSSYYRFHRGGSGQYAHGNNSVLIRDDKGGKIWCNGDSVTNALSMYPEMPGGLSVYVFSTSSNARWGRLGLDRTSTTRHGGKRVAELISFGSEVSEENRALMEKLLMKKWRPSDAYVDSVVAGASVHVDASSASNFNYIDGKITGWKNAGMDADLYRPEEQYYASADGTYTPYTPAYGAYGYTNGVPAFLMGAYSSTVDLMFTRLTNIRSVFWVMDIVPDKPAFFLGDAKTPSNSSPVYNFHRQHLSTVGAYAHASYGPAFINAITRCDRVAVASVTTERPPIGTHVYDLVTKADYTASSLSKDRADSVRHGGRAISELLIFTNSVAGLTRDAISERLENRWTKRCGWAGAGDAEWGEGKYRVFGADAAVPAGGAAADGVGFTASATLSGGTLTLDDGGIFASEGAEATISAPVTGKVGAYGPGVVSLTMALGTVDSISVGNGATLKLVAGTTTVSGGLSIQENGKLVVDASALAERVHASITFNSLSLPAGGSLYDYVSLVGWEERGHYITFTENAIHVNSPDVAAVAVWTAAQNTNLENPANWSCRNFNGEPVANVIPEVSTTSVTFNADCDLRVLGTVRFGDGVAFDLNGHSVQIAGLADQGYPLSSVTNSDASATAELRIDVANGLNITNATVAIGGKVNFVKDGEGTFVAAKTHQAYVGVNEVTNGVLEVAYAVRDSRNYVFGAQGNPFIVREGATFKMNGMFAQADAAYKFVLDGGRLLGCYADASSGYGQIHLMELTKDSTFEIANNCGLVPGGSFSSTELDLGGHTLTVPIGSGKYFFLYNTTVKNGTVNITSGGYLQTQSEKTVIATNADFRVGSAMRIYGTISVRDYEQVYSSNYNFGDAAFNVHGTFKPATHNYFYGCTMQDGSTIDLSSRTDALPLVSSFTNGDKTLKFAPGTIRVKLGERIVTRDTCLISWSAKPDGIASTRFMSAEGERSRRFSARADGLYLTGGMMLIVR